MEDRKPEEKERGKSDWGCMTIGIAVVAFVGAFASATLDHASVIGYFIFNFIVLMVIAYAIKSH